jgi:hypothetical protein
MTQKFRSIHGSPEIDLRFLRHVRLFAANPFVSDLSPFARVTSALRLFDFRNPKSKFENPKSVSGPAGGECFSP